MKNVASGCSRGFMPSRMGVQPWRGQAYLSIGASDSSTERNLILAGTVPMSVFVHFGLSV